MTVAISMAVASLVVPFLPMMPTQILLNNFLYDFSQIGIERATFAPSIETTTSF
jgi:P-type Mg2+ transporter